MEMKTNAIGKYLDQASGKEYEVLKRIKQIRTPNGSFLDGTVDYITRCGINLSSEDDEEKEFMLIEEEGFITRI